MGKMSRDKGKRGELLLAKKLREFGYEARRGQQFSGKNGDADVVGLPMVHLEVKNTEKFRLWDALDQSQNDAREDEMPVVVHKKNRKDWVVVQPLIEWLELYEAWAKEKSNEENSNTEDKNGSHIRGSAASE